MPPVASTWASRALHVQELQSWAILRQAGPNYVCSVTSGTLSAPLHVDTQLVCRHMPRACNREDMQMACRDSCLTRLCKLPDVTTVLNAHSEQHKSWCQHFHAFQSHAFRSHAFRSRAPSQHSVPHRQPCTQYAPSLQLSVTETQCRGLQTPAPWRRVRWQPACSGPCPRPPKVALSRLARDRRLGRSALGTTP